MGSAISYLLSAVELGPQCSFVASLGTTAVLVMLELLKLLFPFLLALSSELSLLNKVRGRPSVLDSSMIVARQLSLS